MDWTELQDDLLRFIAKKVKDVSDFVRLRTVCKRWRSVVHLSDMAPQSPYIINVNWKSSYSFDVQFRQSLSQSVHTVLKNLSLKDQGTIIYGSLNGFLVFHTRKNSKPLLLLNPLTGFHIPLPFEEAAMYTYPIYFGESCCPKTNPVQNGIDVMSIFYDNKRIRLPNMYEACLWRYDDMQWTISAKVPCSNDRITYCNGRLCMASQEIGHAAIIDINSGKSISIHCPSTGLMYLVEAGSDLLCVFRNVKELESIFNSNYQFEVYMLEDFGTNPHFSKLKSIENHVIFIGNKHNALCMKASDCEGYQSNCIYLNTVAIKGQCELHGTIIMYDMGNNTSEVILSCDNLRNKWLIPSLL